MRWLVVCVAACTESVEPALPQLDTRMLATGPYGNPLLGHANGELMMLSRLTDDSGFRVLAFADPARGCDIAFPNTNLWGFRPSTDDAIVLAGTGGGGLLEPVDLDYFDSACAPALAHVTQAVAFSDGPVQDNGRVRGEVVATTSEVLFLDRDSRTTRVVSSNLSGRLPKFRQFAYGDPRLWIAEPQAVVALDVDGNELARFGNAVTDMASSGDAVAYIDSGALYHAAVGSAPIGIAVDACRPELNGMDLTYLSPCVAGQLTLYRVDTGERTPLAQGAVAWHQYADWLAYWTQDNTLYIKPPLGEPVLVAIDGEVEASLRDGRFLILVGRDLSWFSIEAGMQHLAANVSEVYVGSTFVAALRSDQRLTIFDRNDWSTRYSRIDVDDIGPVFARDLPFLAYLHDSGDDIQLELWDANSGEAFLVAGHDVFPFYTFLQEPERGLVFANDDGIGFAPL